MSVKGVVLKAYFDINVLLRHFHKDLWGFFFCDYPAYTFGFRSSFFSENGGDGIKLSLVLRRDCCCVWVYGYMQRAAQSACFSIGITGCIPSCGQEKQKAK